MKYNHTFGLYPRTRVFRHSYFEQTYKINLVHTKELSIEEFTEDEP